MSLSRSKQASRAFTSVLFLIALVAVTGCRAPSRLAPRATAQGAAAPLGSALRSFEFSGRLERQEAAGGSASAAAVRAEAVAAPAPTPTADPANALSASPDLAPDGTPVRLIQANAGPFGPSGLSVYPSDPSLRDVFIVSAATVKEENTVAGNDLITGKQLRIRATDGLQAFSVPASLTDRQALMQALKIPVGEQLILDSAAYNSCRSVVQYVEDASSSGVFGGLVIVTDLSERRWKNGVDTIHKVLRCYAAPTDFVRQHALFLYNPASGANAAVLFNGFGDIAAEGLYDGPWATGLVVVPGPYRNPFHPDFVLYRPSTGEAWAAPIDANGRVSGVHPLDSVTWARNLTLVPLVTSSGTGLSSLLAYDPASGLSTLVTLDGNLNTIRKSDFADLGRNRTLVAGDFNGDGVTDLLIYELATGRNQMLLLAPGGRIFKRVTLDGDRWAPYWTSIAAGDLNGDGVADLFFYNKYSGQNGVIYFDFSGQIQAEHPFEGLLATGYDQVVAGDQDGDGISDLFLYNSSNGANYQVLMARYGYVKRQRLLEDRWSSGWSVSFVR